MVEIPKNSLKGYTVGTSKFHINEYNPVEMRLWDEYCDKNYASYASYSHWHDVLPKLGYKPVFLVAKNELNHIVGILPAVLSLRRGYRLGISTWADGRMYAGPIGDNPEIVKQLIVAFETICKKNKIYIIRIIPNPWVKNAAYPEIVLPDLGHMPKIRDNSDKHHTFVLALNNGYDAIFKKLSGTNRSAYRKSIRDGLVIKQGKEHFTWDMYYNLKRKVWRRLGNMCPDRNEMALIYSLPDPLIGWFSAWYEENFVGCLYCYKTSSIYSLKGSIFDANYPKLNINLRLYLESIKSACEEGMKYYDFGSTHPPSSSHYAWKSKFRGMPYPITYYEKAQAPFRVLLRKILLRLGHLIGHEYTYRFKKLDRIVRWFEE